MSGVSAFTLAGHMLFASFSTSLEDPCPAEGTRNMSFFNIFCSAQLREEMEK